MQIIFTIARHEYRHGVRRRGYLIFTALVPALMLLALGIALSRQWFPASSDAEAATQTAWAARPIGVIDQSGQFMRAASSERFQAFPNQAAAVRAVKAGQLSGLIIIPADYPTIGQLTLYAPSETRAALSDETEIIREFFITRLLQNKVDEASMKHVVAIINTTEPTGRMKVVPIDRSPQSADSLQIVTRIAITLMTLAAYMTSLFVSAQHLSNIIADERHTLILEIILSSVSALELFLGKFIALSALSLTQVGVWFIALCVFSLGAAPVLIALLIWSNPQLTLLALSYAALGYILINTWVAAANTFGVNALEGRQYGGLIFGVAFLSLYLLPLAFAAPNSWLVRLLSFFPLTTPTVMLFRLATTEISNIDISASLLILFISIPLSWRLSVKLLRAGFWLQGRRPSRQELQRLWRAA